MKHKLKHHRFTILFSVAVISALFLVCSLPQSIEAKEELSEWTNSEGVRENTTVYATSALGPSLEFYMHNGFVDTPKSALGTGTGKLQIDMDILIGSTSNKLAITWYTGVNNTLIGASTQNMVTINGNQSITIQKGSCTPVNYNITYFFPSNNWVHLRIIKPSTTETDCNITVLLGRNTFTGVATSSFNGNIKILSKISSSVFVDNIQIHYTSSILEVAAGWYDTIVYHEYFPVVMVLVFGLLAIAVIKGVFKT